MTCKGRWSGEMERPGVSFQIMYCIGIINEGVVKGRMHTGPSRCSVIGRSSTSGDSLLLNRQREVPLWFGWWHYFARWCVTASSIVRMWRKGYKCFHPRLVEYPLWRPPHLMATRRRGRSPFDGLQPAADDSAKTRR